MKTAAYILSLTFFLMTAAAVILKEPPATAQDSQAIPPDIERLKRQGEVLDKVIQQKQEEIKEAVKPKTITKTIVKKVAVKPEVLTVFFRHNGHVIKGSIEKCEQGYYVLNIDPVLHQFAAEFPPDTVTVTPLEPAPIVKPVKQTLWKKIFCN